MFNQGLEGKGTSNADIEKFKNLLILYRACIDPLAFDKSRKGPGHEEMKKKLNKAIAAISSSENFTEKTITDFLKKKNNEIIGKKII